MDRHESAVAEAIATLDARSEFTLTPECYWVPTRQATRHLHLAHGASGFSPSTLILRVVLSAACNNWDVKILDLDEEYRWADPLARVMRISDGELAAAEAWMLTEDHAVANPRPALVVIPDYRRLPIDRCPRPERLKASVATGEKSPHVVLGHGCPADPAFGWQTL